MQPRLLHRFKRITYSTSYLPEIDGLRFLAVFSVVVIMHIPNYMNERFYAGGLLQSRYWTALQQEGGNGVILFFAISGFILALPFAKWRMRSGKKVNLKNYYLRRVTRLEPPYIIALLLFFAANVWVLHKYSFTSLIPHFLASAVYLHTLVYDAFSPVLPVAWSLEVEVQFYVLAPLFFLVFLIRSKLIRMLIYGTVILAGSYLSFDYWGTGNVLVFLNTFFIGILLADLYCTGTALFKNDRLGMLIGIAALLGYWLIPSLHNWPGYFAKRLCILLLFHTVLTNARMKKPFSAVLITVIGGMCYSIYLLHLGIISAAGTLFLNTHPDRIPQSFAPLYALGFIVLVLIASSVYFLLVEKPFMKPLALPKRARETRPVSGI